jgi:predicted N-acetyltransferase YhbS
MSDSNDKRIAELVDYGDAHPDFVDELVRIEDEGVVSHLIFARRQRCGGTMERRVVARLIVPTHLVKQIGHLLVTGKCGEAPPISEEARLH